MEAKNAGAREDCWKQCLNWRIGCKEEDATGWRLLKNFQECIRCAILHAFNPTNDAKAILTTARILQPALDLANILNGNDISFHRRSFAAVLLRNICGARDHIPILTLFLDPKLIQYDQIRMNEFLQLMIDAFFFFKCFPIRNQLPRKPFRDRHLPKVRRSCKQIRMRHVAAFDICSKLGELFGVADNRMMRHGESSISHLCPEAIN